MSTEETRKHVKERKQSAAEFTIVMKSVYVISNHYRSIKRNLLHPILGSFYTCILLFKIYITFSSHTDRLLKG